MRPMGKQRRISFLVVGLLGSQLLLMSLQARHPDTQQSMLRVWAVTAFAPFLSTVTRLFSGVRDVWHQVVDLHRLGQENDALREEVARLRWELHQYREAAKLAERLAGYARFQRALAGESVVARVIGRDVAAWFQTIVIDRGRRDGVRLNAAVVTPDGLVGRVVALGPFSAQVQLITDERSGAGAVIGVTEDSRAVGVLEGRSEALCTMRYVPGNVEVAEGEIVYTTGQDGIYPRGIPIGRVLSVSKRSALVSQEITVEPLASLGKLEEVIVLLNRPASVNWDTRVASGQ
ncbi:MAG: rod shape-determining protein MreC [Acidobacteria bacterium]|nr:MAG: rod shape-determining protein MreC [Acidobacteriota bacterium]